MKIHRLKQFANQLKINQTNAENRLWFYLKNRQIEGYKFKRQVILEGYIVDFVCLEKKLIIELDGSQHIPQWHDDNERTYKLNKEGFSVIRFWNDEILKYTEAVLEKIRMVLVK